MTKINENLPEILDIELIEEKELEIIDEKELTISGEVEDVVEEDVNFARKNIKELIKNGNAAISKLIDVASASQHPRAYEVLATLMKNLSELNKDLLELQKRKKDLSPQKFNKNQNISVDKAIVFTGSTTELISLIKNQKET